MTDFWKDRRVFLTGHTGFKGGWLSLWLHRLGAEVHGYALTPPTTPSLFEVGDVGDALAAHRIGDIRDAAALQTALHAASPEIVFHLAAQPLVRRSYVEPAVTYATNVMGTLNLLEAVRSCKTVRAVVSVTTDKVYDNREWNWPYRESEALGGADPYSSSKACAELVTSSYRSSFLAKAGVAVATARAGNVLGGGDWADDRLIPDVLRAADQGVSLAVRYPGATRPWQHVLEPLSGYLAIAEALCGDQAEAVSRAWNFGPSDDDARPVNWILERMAAKLPGTRWHVPDGGHVHEARYLKLDSSDAKALLKWRPRWSLDRALDETIHWHRRWRTGDDMHAVCLGQIDAFVSTEAC